MDTDKEQIPGEGGDADLNEEDLENVSGGTSATGGDTGYNPMFGGLVGGTGKSEGDPTGGTGGDPGYDPLFGGLVPAKPKGSISPTGG